MKEFLISIANGIFSFIGLVAAFLLYLLLTSYMPAWIAAPLALGTFSVFYNRKDIVDAGSKWWLELLISFGAGVFLFLVFLLFALCLVLLGKLGMDGDTVLYGMAFSPFIIAGLMFIAALGLYLYHVVRKKRKARRGLNADAVLAEADASTSTPSAEADDTDDSDALEIAKTLASKASRVGLWYLGLMLAVNAVFAFFISFTLSSSTLLIVAAALALVAALILTFKRRSLLAVVMWFTALGLGFGLLFVGPSALISTCREMITTYEAPFFICNSHGNMFAENFVAAVRILIITVIFVALYPFIHKKAIVLWAIGFLLYLIPSFVTSWYVSGVEFIATDGDNTTAYHPYATAIFGIGACLRALFAAITSAGYREAFIATSFYIPVLFTLACSIYPAIKAYPRMSDAPNPRRAPFIIAALWAAVHVLVPVVIWFVLFCGCSITEQAFTMRHTIQLLADAVGLPGVTMHNILFCVLLPIDLIVSWVLYSWVKRLDPAYDWFDED